MKSIARASIPLLFALVACSDLTRPAQVAEQRPAEVSPADPPLPGTVPAGGAGWSSVAVGQDRSCALDVGGRAWCWGAEGHGPLATGGATDVCFSVACVPAPSLVRTTTRFSAISVGALHVCAIALDGRAWCWGDNARGQLGVASPRLASEPVPANAAGRFVAIAAGADHTCALRSDGVVLCWGGSDMGQLGRGNLRADDVPAPVSGSFRFTAIAAGQERSCGVATTGDSYCWGAIWQNSQDGVEFSRRQAVPERVPSGVRFSKLSVGLLSSCGIEATGGAWCWEANGFGQMGTLTLSGSTTPLRVVDGDGFTEVAVGLVQSCGIDAARRGWCWGNNSFGQLGNPAVRAACGTADLSCTRTPVQVTGSLRFTQIAAGLGSHACAVTTLTNLYCWGLGTGGQLGVGDPAVQLRQVPSLVAARPADGTFP